jgi:ribosome-associated protein
VTTKKKMTKKKTGAKSHAKKAPVKKLHVKTTKTAKKRLAKPTHPKKVSHGLPEQLRDAALKVLSDRQADDVVTVALAGKSTMADYLLIASGRAARQISAIAHHLRQAFEKLGIKQFRIEGLPEANWVIVDAGDVIVHLFRPDVRRYYDLDRIWKP